MPSSKKLFSYIRVSTVKQGERGTSLEEQRAAIRNYAARYGLEIVREFQEMETAAKRGRPVFNEMLKELKRGKADGLIIHKIDRSARNLKDWADLGELIDAGIDVHFTNESLDLKTRGGRLSADIQAVVAADYIRNLREETRKGFYGRLKQGAYPLPAPLGYLDRGRGEKVPDPVRAPLVVEAFELYATGNWTLESLLAHLNSRGIRNRRGNTLSINGLHRLLRNPFYMGIIRIQTTGEYFQGKHKPLILKVLFEEVQEVFRGKHKARKCKHFFLFRRFLRCSKCGSTLIGELQKGHVYYRCHNPVCHQKTIREEFIEEAVAGKLKQLRFSELENKYLKERISVYLGAMNEKREAFDKSLRLQLTQLKDRLSRLTDALIDGIVDKDIFQQKKSALLFEQRALEDKLASLIGSEGSVMESIEKFLELINSAYLTYKTEIHAEKRELVKIMTSNLEVDGKNVMVKLKNPFALVENRLILSYGSPIGI